MRLLFIILLGPAQKSLFKMHPQLLTAHSTGRCGVVLFLFQGNSGVKIVSLLNKQWSKAKVANEFLKARAVSGELNHLGGWGAGEKYTSEDRSDICINLMFIEDPKCNESLQTSGFYKPWAGTLSWKASNAKTVNVNSGFPDSLKASRSWLLAAERIFISSPSTNPHLTCSFLEPLVPCWLQEHWDCFLKLPIYSCSCERLLVRDVIEERKLATVKRQSQNRWIHSASHNRELMCRIYQKFKRKF